MLRVEHGIAKVGIDATERTIALEARLQRSISFNKGCYLGQETIERATRAAGSRRALRLRFEHLFTRETALFLDGKEAVA